MTIYSGFSHWKWWFSIVIYISLPAATSLYLPENHQTMTRNRDQLAVELCHSRRALLHLGQNGSFLDHTWLPTPTAPSQIASHSVGATMVSGKSYRTHTSMVGKATGPTHTWSLVARVSLKPSHWFWRTYTLHQTETMSFGDDYLPSSMTSWWCGYTLPRSGWSSHCSLWSFHSPCAWANSGRERKSFQNAQSS